MWKIRIYNLNPPETLYLESWVSVVPSFTDRSESLNSLSLSVGRLLPLSRPSSYHAWVKVFTKEWVCPPVSIHQSMWPDLIYVLGGGGAHFSSFSPVFFASY